MRRRVLVFVVGLSFVGLLAPVVLANIKPDYWLPYDNSVGRKVSQGNGGTGTHGTQPDYYAWDFSGGGWVIRAARSGAVVGKQEDLTANYCPPEPGKKGNFVRIDHGDGYESLYYHLRPNTVPYAVGDKVRRYANVGLTGETGNACGEHLHYQVQPDGCASSVDFCGDSVPSSFVDDTVPSNGVPTVIPSPTLTARNHVPDRLLRRDGNRKTEILKTTGAAWQMTFSGQGAWSSQGSANAAQIANITLGDFNNDGKADVFTTTITTGNCAGGPGWLVSYSRPNNPPQTQDPFGVWGPALCTTQITLSDLGFGDFNGDGRTDVIQASPVSPWCGPGAGLEISYGGTGSWTTLLCTSATLPAIGLADFNGDGKTDTFRNTSTGNCGSGTKLWHISYGGNGPWTQVNCSAATFAEMAFRDFNNNGATDVFHTSGSVWHRIDGGVGTWIWMRDSSDLVSGGLGFGDFNGDGYTDAFSTEPDAPLWYVSWSGTASWTNLNSKPETLPDLLLGMRDRG